MTQNRLRNLDLGTLRSFVTIADTGSMTRAAGRLFMTQSAVSMQIKRLESSLGMSVFERSAQGMKPTSEGEQLLQFANQMLALNDEAMGRLTSPDFEGVIRFGAPGDVIYPHIPGILREFSRDFPRVQLKFCSSRTVVLREQFEQGLQDIVLTTERKPVKGGKIVCTMPLTWIGAEDGSAWKKRPLPLCISRNCAFRPGIIQALDDAAIEWVDIVSSDDDLAGEAMTSADLGIRAEMKDAIYSGARAIEHGGQLPELPKFSIILYCDRRSGNHLVESLADYLTRAYA
jgi:DNA-binding transcriptional LysR family regulator